MLTRRAFVRLVGVGAGAGALGSTRLRAGDRHAGIVPPNDRFVCLDGAAAGFVIAACECLVPATPASPGATAAGVARFIDAQLSSDWGQGRTAVRHADWQAGTPIPRRATQFTPAQFFLTAARAIQRNLQPATAFERLAPRAQRHLLETLNADNADLDGVSSREFLDALARLTAEGYFRQPKYAATRDRIAWPLSGFTGGHAAVSSQLG